MKYFLIYAISRLGVLILGRVAYPASSAKDGTDQMRYPLMYPGIGAVGAVAWGVFVIASQTLWSNAEGTTVALVISLLFAALCVFMFVDGLGTRHRVLPDGLRHHWPFRGDTMLRWDEIDRVETSAGMSWWVLSAGGVRRRISYLMSNQPLFAEMMLARVLPGAMSEEVRALLTKAAAGAPPRAF